MKTRFLALSVALILAAVLASAGSAEAGGRRYYYRNNCYQPGWGGAPYGYYQPVRYYRPAYYQPVYYGGGPRVQIVVPIPFLGNLFGNGGSCR